MEALRHPLPNSRLVNAITSQTAQMQKSFISENISESKDISEHIYE